MTLGEKIKNHRLNKGMNLREFGEYIDNTSDSIVSRWEKIFQFPKLKDLN